RRTCTISERGQTGGLPGPGLCRGLDLGPGPAGPCRPGGNHLYPFSCSWLFLLLGAGFCDCLATKGGRRTPRPRIGSPAGAKLFGPLEILVDANRQMPDDCVRDPHSPLDFGYFGPGPFNRKNYIVAVFEFLDRVGEAPPAHSVYLGYAGALVGCNFAEL